MSRLTGVILALALIWPAAAEGLFLGAELVPWNEAHVAPIFTFGWEGPAIAPHRTGFVATFGLVNPAMLDNWYMMNLSLLAYFPRTDNIRVGVGIELWAQYSGGRITGQRNSINGTFQILAGAARLYLKPHLPYPIRTSAPYLGVSLTIGFSLLMPALLPAG